MNGKNYEVPHCGAFSTPHSHPSWAQIFASGSCFQIPLACIPPLMEETMLDKINPAFAEGLTRMLMCYFIIGRDNVLICRASLFCAMDHQLSSASPDETGTATEMLKEAALSQHAETKV